MWWIIGTLAYFVPALINVAVCYREAMTINPDAALRKQLYGNLFMWHFLLWWLSLIRRATGRLTW